ncbi:hypothetical protein TNCV_4063821 [Trichonephila clavipes]|nr:hypothetical protein TNCV_4063821 [Trichonephila clavipes]
MWTIALNLAILDLGQATRMTLEMVPPSLNYPTTTTVYHMEMCSNAGKPIDQTGYRSDTTSSLQKRTDSLYSIMRVVGVLEGREENAHHLLEFDSRVNEKIAQFYVTVKKRTEVVFPIPRIVAMVRREREDEKGERGQWVIIAHVSDWSTCPFSD